MKESPMTFNARKAMQLVVARPIRSRFARAARLLIATALLGMTTLSNANDLVVTHTALLAVLKDQAFRTGRLDLVPPTPCVFAYLESPLIVIAKGRLALAARLTGRTGLPSGNQCVGSMGDSIDIVASGRAFYRDGRIGLDDLRIDQLSNEFYRALLTPMLQVAVGRVVDIDLRKAVRDMLVAGKVPLTVKVEELDVSRLIAEDNRIEATFRFRAIAR
jgi:hypothetical protein